MTSGELRKNFISFFERKGHKFIPPSPIVVKNDPTLMFTNAGMNQFKDVFLGYKQVDYKRAVNSQKCLRVSGKHNDLEEVGIDTYHHTMFEMLGNWSFGDYFKREAIEWAWEYLTEVLRIDKDSLYVTYFEGDDNLSADIEAKKIWEMFLPKERIIKGSRKDNFWEMGETGPCGPCTEIHIDMRSEQEKKEIPGFLLINKGNPNVIEIWNLVFIQYNRNSDQSLTLLPNKHVDTGMGFERLCMIVQNKRSNYETDLFIPIIKKIESICNINYGEDSKKDIAFRVIADHLRAVSFTIADGQLPSNTGAGYVIRRILRRAVRYAYSYLNQNEPFIYKLVGTLANTVSDYFPEIKEKQNLIEKIICEEEGLFIKTLENGLKRYEMYIIENKAELEKTKTISGKFAFDLYDTYGFPIDLTNLLAKEDNLKVDLNEYERCLEIQKERSRKASLFTASSWNIINNSETVKFVGYDTLVAESNLTRYRTVTYKGKTLYHLVFDVTPFYAESGGQVGDKGWLISADNEKVRVIDTIKEYDLTIHVVETLPKNLTKQFILQVDEDLRKRTQHNHTATHLLHYSLRKILGRHVEQKGSLVHPDYLRFDFSHFQKLKESEIYAVEKEVNNLIWNAYALNEYRNMPFEDAIKMGAIALFGEKYGKEVRVVSFGPTIELCGGTHAKNTAEIGLFKIVSEQAIASGIRRIEAITNFTAFEYLNSYKQKMEEVSEALGRPKDILIALTNLRENFKSLQKKYEILLNKKIIGIENELKNSFESYNDINVLIKEIEIEDANKAKDIALRLRNVIENSFVALVTKEENKIFVFLSISDNLLRLYNNLDASLIAKELSKIIGGGGGGQKFFATCTGNEMNKSKEVLMHIKNYIIEKIKKDNV
ncbi:MAG: alanine--tRNA ligase [Bacteroidales bacterium]|nr:alanine--tRNA ligase [Bacteroidales bacterium]